MGRKYLIKAENRQKKFIEEEKPEKNPIFDFFDRKEDNKDKEISEDLRCFGSNQSEGVSDYIDLSDSKSF